MWTENKVVSSEFIGVFEHKFIFDSHLTDRTVQSRQSAYYIQY